MAWNNRAGTIRGETFFAGKSKCARKRNKQEIQKKKNNKQQGIGSAFPLCLLQISKDEISIHHYTIVRKFQRVHNLWTPVGPECFFTEYLRTVSVTRLVCAVGVLGMGGGGQKQRKLNQEGEDIRFSL